MSDEPQDDLTEFQLSQIDPITDVRHYTGGEPCDYDCDNVAEFVIEVEDTATFFTCYDCANSNHIYPQDRLDLLRTTDKERWS